MGISSQSTWLAEVVASCERMIPCQLQIWISSQLLVNGRKAQQSSSKALASLPWTMELCSHNMRAPAQLLGSKFQCASWWLRSCHQGTGCFDFFSEGGCSWSSRSSPCRAPGMAPQSEKEVWLFQKCFSLESLSLSPTGWKSTLQYGVLHENQYQTTTYTMISTGIIQSSDFVPAILRPSFGIFHFVQNAVAQQVIGSRTGTISNPYWRISLRVS